ncbi:sugar ABC transporter ATP-binding protein [Paenibacillus thalictri]|uniref:Sugar ABC transporter ATP-binding protein n=1 Tax=Paenibacillus thalictri TaxID=2527873 RepID=A0A4Q9DMH3_9BACL|nr:sugar ABC transporter ATP-binding protein [Paenibacillus thalictri]TBL76540.1 sugar ABC transporter ATP-binding protein [Paenibacillus thalictri]
MAAILEYKDVCKSFFGIPVLKNVNFSLEQGKVLGLVGENGAGKSTLMNILGGVLPYDKGQVLLDNQLYAPQNPIDAYKAKIAFIHQELNLFSNLTIAENIFISEFPQKRFMGLPVIDRKWIRQRCEEILQMIQLPVSPDTPVEKLSQGERQLVEIAKAISQEARIIIFDEPTTSLTAREAEKLFAMIETLKRQGISMIYISHILQDIYRLCDEIVVLRDGEVVRQDSSRDIPMDQMITAMVGRQMNQLYPQRNSKTGDMLLEVKGLSQEGIVENIHLGLRAGEVVGISGLMGSGRSELARILFGLDPYGAGEVRYKGKPLKKLTPRLCIEMGMAFLTENRREEGLLMENSIADNLSLVALPKFAGGIWKFIRKTPLWKKVQTTAGMIRIASVNPEIQEVRTLSGGNQQKVVIGKWVINDPSVFILDEPTRGIDVGAKYDVYTIINQLAEKGAGILMISSELEELIGMCDRILVMNSGEITANVQREHFDRETILKYALGGASV